MQAPHLGGLASAQAGDRHKKKETDTAFFWDKARRYIYNLYSACYLRRPQAKGKSAAVSTNNIYIAEARGSVRKSHVVVFVGFSDTLPQPSAGFRNLCPKHAEASPIDFITFLDTLPQPSAGGF